MSAFLLGTGFRADMGTCIRKLVLLKLIDACEDDGSRIFPAMKTVARAAQCSERQVQREIGRFVAVRLLRLVKAGGAGPRSTNEYALDLDLLARLGKEGWAAVAGEPHSEEEAGSPSATSEASELKDGAEKGDTQSPLEDAEKGDTGDSPRVTPATDKGDSVCHPTPPDSSLDPSIERERGREDDPKAIERTFEKAYRAWPTSIGDSRPKALEAWLALSPAERIAAAADASRYVAAAKENGRKLVCSHAVYLREKRWEGLPPPPDEAAKPVYAPAFGPVWGALRMRELGLPPKEAPPASGFLAQMLARHDASGEAARRERRARYGWPRVAAMHEGALSGRGVTVSAELAALGALCEPVPVGSAMWDAWAREHERRGWPWLPDPGGQRVVFFPAGGPAGLEAFERAMADNRSAA